MIVREAVAGDAEAIADLVNPVIRDTAITFTTAEKRPADLAGLIAEAGGTYHVAEIDGAVVGYATYFQFRGGPGYARTMEHSITISEAVRGRGAGRALMSSLEAHARARAVHSMFAGVSAENPAGIAFHARLGYQHIALLPQVGFKFGRWMDLVLMQKFL